MLQEIIKNIIQREGPITFARFMELALYHPQYGYYFSGKTIIGKEGDFFTSPHVHSIFGETLADQIGEMGELINTGDFKIVEFGAGRGFLAFDLLKTLEQDCRSLFNRTTYYIIEASAGLKEKQQGLLAQLGLPEEKVKWIDSLWDVTKPFNGCIISNELVDAFPVHVVEQSGEKMREIFVGWDGEKLFEIPGEFSTPLIPAYFSRLGIQFEDGQRGEVNLAALNWIRDVGRALGRGFVLTIDYGYEAQLLYHPVRKSGTIMCYQGHRAHSNPYINVGKQDITSHVNFTALDLWGRDSGLVVSGIANQMHFLFNLGIIGKIGRDTKRAAAVQQLASPEGMGGIFKVMIQHKGMARPKLKGLTDVGPK